MEAFTLVDGIVLVVIVLSAILAWARGLVREILSIAGWVAAAFAGFAFAYKTVFGGSGGVPQIDNSHSAALFGDLEARIQAMLPADAPQWIAGQYDRLTQSCNIGGTQG